MCFRLTGWGGAMSPGDLKNVVGVSPGVISDRSSHSFTPNGAIRTECGSAREAVVGRGGRPWMVSILKNPKFPKFWQFQRVTLIHYLTVTVR